jgi:hypothetical protein
MKPNFLILFNRRALMCNIFLKYFFSRLKIIYHNFDYNDPININNFAEYDNVKFHVGNVFDTLSNFDCPNLSLVSIDLNYAPAEEFVLNFIYNRVSNGGIIILDDYAAASRVKQRESYDKQSKILGFSILRTPSGQGIVVKY